MVKEAARSRLRSLSEAQKISDPRIINAQIAELINIPIEDRAMDFVVGSIKINSNEPPRRGVFGERRLVVSHSVVQKLNSVIKHTG